VSNDRRAEEEIAGLAATVKEQGAEIRRVSAHVELSDAARRVATYEE